MTYSLDFRKKVWAIKEKEKRTYEEAAKRFQIEKTTLVRWHTKWEPQKSRNKAATKSDTEASHRLSRRISVSGSPAVRGESKGYL